MTTLHALINSFDGVAAPLLALLALWATVVLGLAWLVAKSWRRVSSAVRYCVWQFALTGLLVLPVLILLLPGIPLGLTFASASRELGSNDPKASLPGGSSAEPALDAAGETGRRPFFDKIGGLQDTPFDREGRSARSSFPAGGSPVQDQQPSISNPAESMPGLLSSSILCVGIWGLGVVAHLAWLARCGLRARRLVRGARSLTQTPVEQRLRSLQGQLFFTRRLRLLMSANTPVPIVVGVLRPRILLPLDCVEWSAERLRMVLSHELAHVERRDVFWQLVARTVSALYWFHPLVWLAVRCMRFERERACDDCVLTAGVQPVDYAAALVEVAAAINGRQKSLAGGICMAERCQLENRVQSILDRSATRRPASARVRRGIFVAAVCLVCVLGSLRPFSPLQGSAAEAPDTKGVPSLQAPPPTQVKTAATPVELVAANVKDAQPAIAAPVESAAKSAAAPHVTVDESDLSVTNAKPFAFQIARTQPGDVSLKVYDANGKFVRLLSQKHVAEKQLSVPWDLKDSGGNAVSPGAYTVRIDSGLRLTFDKTFAKEGLLEDKAFKSPSVVRLDKQGNLYLLDMGSATLAWYNSEGDTSNPSALSDAGGTATLFKFSSDGSAINDWNGKNTIAAPRAPFWGGLAVEPDGSRIYLSETFTANHIIHVYDGKLGTRLFAIGGFCGEDPDWEKEKGGIVDPWWLGLNGESKLYTVSGERFCAFNRATEGKAGGIWQLGGKANPRPGWDSAGDAGDTDGASAIYLASIYYHQRKELFKVVDTGESCRFAYDLRRYPDPQTQKDVELNDICGVAYDGEKGLWVIERATARILKISDDGVGLHFVAAFGARGKNAAELEFLAPRSAAVSPDGKLLYVIEDGDPISKADQATGQARVTRYKIDYADREVLKLTVRP